MDIQYNSWLTSFKEPFGAIKIDSEITFNIKVISKEKVKSVLFVIKKQDDLNIVKEYTMNLNEANKYHYHYQATSGSGLYLYCFKIVAVNDEGQEFCLYYGKSETSGEGYQYISEDSIKWYQLTCYETEDNAPNWYQEGVFYQIFPDRFFNGNSNKQVNAPKTNSFLYGTTEDLPMYIKDDSGDIERWDFYGGNLKGIKNKIPYFKELGITGLYLNPIFEANSNHRYDTNDYFNIDPILGTNDEFKELVDELHENDIQIILDGVFSHVGRNSRYFNFSGSFGENKGAYQNPNSKYRNWFTFSHYPDTYESWWGVADLPEINKHNKDFQNFIYGEKDSVLTFWNQYNIDGWRLDVADELPNFFLKGIRERINQHKEKVVIGEVWEDASNKIAYGESKEYTSHPVLHGVMNYPLRKNILDLVNEDRTIKEVANSLLEMKENYPRHFYYNLFNNLGTHDTARILNECHDSYQKVTLAFSLLFMFPGVPCIYYGDEIGLKGGTDPDNRRFYPWKVANTQLKGICQRWIELRDNNKSLLKGDCTFFYHTKDNLFGIYRFTDKEKSICLFNFSSNQKSISDKNWICEEMVQSETDHIINHFNISNVQIAKQDYLLIIR